MSAPNDYEITTEFMPYNSAYSPIILGEGISYTVELNTNPRDNINVVNQINEEIGNNPIYHKYFRNYSSLTKQYGIIISQFMEGPSLLIKS